MGVVGVVSVPVAMVVGACAPVWPCVVGALSLPAGVFTVDGSIASLHRFSTQNTITAVIVVR